MNTFLPYPSFEKSLKCLDRARLGKQRSECLTMAKALLGKSKAYRNHPATKMWEGHTGALIRFGIAACNEWKARGYKDTSLPKLKALEAEATGFDMPIWFGVNEVHLSYKKLLQYKNPQYYSKEAWDVVPDPTRLYPDAHDPKIYHMYLAKPEEYKKPLARS